MRKMYAALMAIVVTALLSACATTQQESPPVAPAAPEVSVAAAKSADQPGGIIGQKVVTRVVVDSIDYKERTAVLRDSENKLHYFKAGPEIRNFPQLKVGDEVITEQTESVAILVDKPQGKPAGGGAQVAKRAPLGAKPGMEAVNVYEVTAIVEKIDYKNRMITLKGPEGKLITTKVDPSLTRFNEVKKGDMIYMQFTEGLAIRVETPQK
jgi:TolA-binding protein